MGLPNTGHWDLQKNQNHAGDIASRFPIAFISYGGLGREVKRRSVLMGSPDIKLTAVGQTFALTAHQFFSSL